MVKKQPRRDAWAGVLGEPDTGVGVGYVAWKIAGRECFAGSVLPSAGESIICADEFEADAGGQSGKGVAAFEHVAHSRHFTCIK